MPKNILFVINPGSGNNSTNWQTEIENYFNNKDVVLHFIELSKPPDCAAIKKNIEKIQPHIAVAVGGDGTITMVADMLIGTNIKLGILPAGSANGMAKELRIPTVPEKALDIIENGIDTDVDTILINGKHTCLHLSDVGINAELIKNFEEGDSRGQIGYLKVLYRTVVNNRRMQIKLNHENGEVLRDAIMVVIANAGRYGTGAVINPDGEINDGLFEVVVVKRMPPLTLAKMMFSKKFNPKNIEIFHCRSVNITAKRKVHFQVDGEYLGKVKDVSAKILPATITMILPQEYIGE